MKARDVHIAINKPNLLFVLHTSKTHGKADDAQMIKISGSQFSIKDDLCPFNILRKFLLLREKFKGDQEPFFTFQDGTPVTPVHFRCLVHKLLVWNKINPSHYRVHGMRAGRSCDLLDMGVSVETIKKLGRWKSNSVYTYLRS